MVTTPLTSIKDLSDIVVSTTGAGAIAYALPPRSFLPAEPISTALTVINGLALWAPAQVIQYPGNKLVSDVGKLMIIGALGSATLQSVNFFRIY